MIHVQQLIGARLRSRRGQKGKGESGEAGVILAWVSVEYRSTPEPNPHPLVQTNSYLQESQPIPKHAASFQWQPTSAVPEQEEEQKQRHETVAAAQRSPRKRYFFSHGKNKVVLWKYLQSLGAACFCFCFFNIYLQIFFFLFFV